MMTTVTHAKSNRNPWHESIWTYRDEPDNDMYNKIRYWYSESMNLLINVPLKNGTNSISTYFGRRVCDHDFELIALGDPRLMEAPCMTLTLLRDPLERFRSAVTMLSRQLSTQFGMDLTGKDFSHPRHAQDFHITPQITHVLFSEIDRKVEIISDRAADGHQYDFRKPTSRGSSQYNGWEDLLWRIPFENYVDETMEFFWVSSERDTVSELCEVLGLKRPRKSIRINAQERYTEISEGQAARAFKRDYHFIEHLEFLNT